jgi:hypothetical protein
MQVMNVLLERNAWIKQGSLERDGYQSGCEDGKFSSLKGRNSDAGEILRRKHTTGGNKSKNRS